MFKGHRGVLSLFSKVAKKIIELYINLQKCRSLKLLN